MKRKIKTALISVSDKKNLKPLLNVLKNNKIKIISSGGTYKEIKKLKFSCLEVSKFTNSPEILDGRVKTLHPKIHAGILNIRDKKSHMDDLKLQKFEDIDLVVVNFYPFEEILKVTKNHKKVIENIDIGGPSMVRSAAKNYNDVVVITSPNQYEELINQLKKNSGSTSLEFRLKMSRLAFTETAYYDSLISNYFNKTTNTLLPEKKTFNLKLVDKLRYGENPHQKGAIYSKDTKLNIKQIHGQQLGYNNYNDIFTGLNISKSLPKNIGTTIIKHGNPCGVSIKKNHLESYRSALACDPISAFGGIVCCNYKITKKIALELNKLFTEIIVANGFEKEATKILKMKKNLSLIDSTNYSSNEILNFLSSGDKVLVQTEDNHKFIPKDFKVVSKKKPSLSQMKNMIFAFNICRHVKSNAIVIATNETTAGIGSGQPSRLDSSEIAIDKMNKFMNTKSNLVAASDAFFPFVDGIEKLVQSGVSAVIQPYGSIRDKEIIKFANQTEIVLVFSKTRHFRH